MEEKLATVTEVSRGFGVSTRMLRYYEQAGLLTSRRAPGYAYRMYDEDALTRLRQVLLLRRLRIPVREIYTLLQNPDALTAINVFERNVAELDAEIGALAAVRGILRRFIGELQKAADVPLHHLLTSDDQLLSTMDTLALSPINFKEDQTMDNLQKADLTLKKLTDVRIITLPPSAVAAAHFVGGDPEFHAQVMIKAFVMGTRLWEVKPDLRSYGFNHPNPKDETDYHGYELWVTIPDDMDVPPPLEKKHFPGGLYAAHMIPFGEFGDWELLIAWIAASDKYEFAGDFADQAHMCGLLDEHLNFVAHCQLDNPEPPGTQFDLLAPVREKPAEAT